VISQKSGARKVRDAVQEDKKSIEHQDIYDFLEKEFQDTFIDELVPGIVHNFANPLNGIMGRARLLQRKLMEIMKTIDVGKDTSLADNNKKLVYDVESIIRESDRLSVILQSVTGKFCAVSDRTIQRINLSDLIELEMNFFDFYLEFKHSIKKIDYSLALSALIRYSMNATKESESKEFYISTQFENGHVCMTIRNHGTPISDEQKRLLLEESQTDISSLDMTGDGGLMCASSLLKKWGARFDIQYESGFNIISVFIPPR
jgi:signal transduction histidine kinase